MCCRLNKNVSRLLRPGLLIYLIILLVCAGAAAFFDQYYLAAAEAAGVQYMLVEQDDCYGEDPFACLARSYTYLKEKGFE